MSPHDASTPRDPAPTRHPIPEIGIVKWYSLAKGYGFIAVEAGGEDIFVHHSQADETALGPLVEGQQVRFVRVQAERGDQAHQIERL